MPRLDKDPLDVALMIKRGFEKTLGSRDKPKPVDPGYVLGVAVWWLVIFAAASIVGLRWIPAALIATLVCGFWPIVLLFDRTPQD
ncbi:MAG TPA: hypothetical protein VMI56_05410 [Reyranella sp.]|nr:hypothetical protein [Reyranella sp.]